MNKVLASLTAGLLLSTALPAQAIFTYGGKAVSKSEFLHAFEKNPDSGNRKKAMEAYLPLYINYKLKVQDAADKKMDTLPNQKSELDNYRSQLEESFLNEKANTDKLVQEAFDRSQKDIMLGHLFIGFDSKDPASVATAEAQAEKAQAALKAKKDFSTVVNEFSTDANNKKNNGEVGWITVFSVPYTYETAIYNAPVGGITETIKSANGLHIFKKIAERAAVGRVHIAQIMLINADKGNEAREKSNEKLADSLYQVLQKGASFESLAQQFSNDRTSYGNGGVLPEFGPGSYEKTFEQQAFALKTKGEISKPFHTNFGWHILKLIEKIPTPSTLAEADQNGVIKQKVLSGGRTANARANYIKSQIPKMAYKPAPYNAQELWQFTDSALVQGAGTKSVKVKNETPVLSFGKETFNAGQWVEYVAKTKSTNGFKPLKPYSELMQDYTQYAAEQYLRKNLEKYDSGFAQQMREFKDANLLFEAMDKSVWNKAAEDTAGLSKYYKEHTAKYRWGASAAALLVTTSDSAVATEVYSAVKTDPAGWRQLADKYSESLIADSGRFELNQIPADGNVQFAKGMVTTPVKNAMDGSQTFACIFELLPANGQRSFEEARGFVINDYQQVLEERWVAQLKKKYPVVVNDAAWKALLAGTK